MKTIITNEELYHSIVVCVDVTNVKNATKESFYGNVEIVTLFDKNPIKEFDGEFGYNDFEVEFGFKFEN